MPGSKNDIATANVIFFRIALIIFILIIRQYYARPKNGHYQDTEKACAYANFFRKTKAPHGKIRTQSKTYSQNGYHVIDLKARKIHEPSLAMVLIAEPSYGPRRAPPSVDPHYRREFAALGISLRPGAQANFPWQGESS
jgi:hypothetical protein